MTIRPTAARFSCSSRTGHSCQFALESSKPSMRVTARTTHLTDRSLRVKTDCAFAIYPERQRRNEPRFLSLRSISGRIALHLDRGQLYFVVSHAESKHGRWTEVTMGKSMLDSGRVRTHPVRTELPASAGSRPQPHASWFSYIFCSKASWVASVISIFLLCE